MNFAPRASSSRLLPRISLIVLLVIMSAKSGFAQTRAPVPSIEKQKEIAKLLQDTYNLTKLDGTSKKQEAVKKLLEAARDESFGVDERYVVLTTLISLATEMGDGTNFLTAVNSLSAGFEIDPQQEKSRLVIEFLKAGKSGIQLKPVVEESITLSRAAAEENRYADAISLLAAVEAAVQRATGAGGLKPMVAAARDAVTAREKEWRLFQAASTKLDTNTDDPPSHFTVGRWHAIQSADWKTALPFLAKSSDAKWKAAAELEGTEPTDAATQVAIGDAWWEIAQKESGSAKSAVLVHAGQWYEEVQPKLTSGLKKQQVAKRLEEIAPSKPTASNTSAPPKSPSPNATSTPAKATKPGKWVDLLAWANGIDWGPRGVNWNEELSEAPSGQGIALKHGYNSRFPLPAIIDGDYDMDVEFTRTTGIESVWIYFPVGLHSMRFRTSANAGEFSDVAFVKGKEYGRRTPAPVANGQAHRVLIHVRHSGDKASFQIDFDGVTDYISWTGPESDLVNMGGPTEQVTMPRSPWVGAALSRIVFHKINVRMLSGSIRANVVTKADRERDLKDGIVRLVGEVPKAANVASGRFSVNQLDLPDPGENELQWPLITREFKACSDFYGAHAPSSVKCPIPTAAKSFSVVGYNDSSRLAKFQVLIDGKQVYDSGRTPIAVIKVDLPAKASQLELVADPMGNSDRERCARTYWCFPRYHAIGAAQVTDKMLDDNPETFKFIIKSSKVAVGELTRNQPIEGAFSIPIHFRDAVPCDEFLFAHATSSITYQVPKGMSRFTAMGYNVISHSVKYEVWADGARIYESPQAGIVPIDVMLPSGTNSIDLKIEMLGGYHLDHSMWCYPRLHRK